MKIIHQEYQKTKIKKIVNNLKALLFTTLFALLIISCNKDDDKPPLTELEKLPPATQIGANTFGCLLDGVAFKPGVTNNSYNCFYQLVNGEYFFLVTAKNTRNNIVESVFVGTEKQTISQGQTLSLIERTDGNAWGTYFLNTEPFTTNALKTGELKITKLTNQIVAGIFWFDVLDTNGVTHQIREGRFDMQYTN